MKSLLLLALLPIVGCANTPEGQAQFRDNFFNGMAAQQRHEQSRPQPVKTRCTRFFDTVNCTTY